jgi:hypothetical protein
LFGTIIVQLSGTEERGLIDGKGLDLEEASARIGTNRGGFYIPRAVGLA